MDKYVGSNDTTPPADREQKTKDKQTGHDMNAIYACVIYRTLTEWCHALILIYLLHVCPLPINPRSSAPTTPR